MGGDTVQPDAQKVAEPLQVIWESMSDTLILRAVNPSLCYLKTQKKRMKLLNYENTGNKQKPPFRKVG